MTERERLRQLRVDARLAHEAMLAHATAVSEAGAGFHRVSRRRLRFVAPGRNYAAVRRGQWDACIPEDAPIWEACRVGTRVWRAGKEPVE